MELSQIVSEIAEVIGEEKFKEHTSKNSSFVKTFPTETIEQRDFIRKSYSELVEEYKKYKEENHLTQKQLGVLGATIMMMHYTYSKIIVPEDQQYKMRLYSEGDPFLESDLSPEDGIRKPYIVNFFKKD